jgi:hypothetical protein
MPLTETRTVKDGDKVVSESERKLYTLAELKADKHIEDEPTDVIDSRVGGAYEKALDQLREATFEYEWWEAALDTIGEVFKACGIDYKASEVEFDLDRGSKFVLPNKTSVDEKAFLKALKIYLSGVDVRVPLLEYGDTPGNADTAIKAVGTQVRNLDLRSRDARIIREQGLVVYRVNNAYNSRSDEFDFDYHYPDELSDQFRADANEFLSDLCHYGLKVLRDEMEYLGSEENLLEMAEANEYTFDRTGRRA